MPTIAYFRNPDELKDFPSGAWQHNLYVRDGNNEKPLGQLMHAWVYRTDRCALVWRPDSRMHSALCELLTAQEHAQILRGLMNQFWSQLRANYEMGYMSRGPHEIRVVIWQWPHQASDNTDKVRKAWEMFQQEKPQAAHIHLQIELYQP